MRTHPWLDWLLPIAGLLLLLLPCTMVGLGRLPWLATPTPAPAPAAVTLADCHANDDDPALLLAPDGRHCAIVEQVNRVYVVAGDGRTLDFSWSKWVRFVGWTADGRFALAEPHDQYGNRRTIVFDTLAWTVRDAAMAPDDTPCGMSGTCRHGVAAIAPRTARVVLADGRLVDLVTGHSAPMPPPADLPYIATAAWSPDERYLALAGTTDMPPHRDARAYLIIANGDGRDGRLVPLHSGQQSPWPLTLAWRARTLHITTTIGPLTFDPATR